jgi:Na+/proline symporter
MVAFAALAMHPEMRSWALPDAHDLPNPESGYPIVMRELAPIGLRGLMLVTFFAAFMSTISTQMNWGASYVVNDLYRRFIRPDADARQFVRVSRIASGVVLLLGGAVSYYMIVRHSKIDDAWQLLMALGAGLGSVLILRWFWWRISAWSEIAAMAGSITFFIALAPLHLQPSYHAILVALASLLLWLVVTLLTRPESDATLLTFFRKVRPDGPGWSRIRGLAPEARPDGTLAASLLCALLGTVAIWLTLPGVGAVIFGEWTKATLCLLGAAVALAVLLRMLPRLQPRAPVDEQP